MARLLFATAIKLIVPPWLQRTSGAKLMMALGDVMDEQVDRTTDSVWLRFPTDSPDPDALTYMGRDRRFRRGPNEPPTNFARRMLRWWEAHKRRGSPYEMLTQLWGYFYGTLSAPFDVVAYSGLRHSIDVNGVVTQDQITWSADGSNRWARIWVFFYLAADPGVLTEDQKEVYRAIPRDWSAAHLDKITIVLLWGDAGLWGYPPGKLWGDTPGEVWGGGGSGAITFEV